MEKGLYLLEAIIAGAPLIGLLGTATGLVQVFSVLPSTGLSGGTEVFSEGYCFSSSYYNYWTWNRYTSLFLGMPFW